MTSTEQLPLEAQYSQAQLELAELEGRKRQLESSLDALFASLGPVGMEAPLTDAEGFPRDDIDVYQVRQDRHRVRELQTDNKALLLQLDEVVGRVFGLKRALGTAAPAPASASASPRDSDELARLAPFALVNAVSPDSPASAAGLLRGDRVLFFGSTTSAQPNPLGSLATLVPANVDRPIKVVVQRDGEGRTLYLTPRSCMKQQPGGESLLFAAEERVLCFHGPLLYEAKVLKAEYWSGKAGFEDGGYFFVHYLGWKASWDEWVPESRVLKYNAENLKRQQELVASHGTRKAKEKKAASATTSTSSAGGGGGGTSSTSGADVERPGTDRGKKRRNSVLEKEEEFLKRPEVKIPIPESLKMYLVQDWENVTKKQLLISLPRTPTVVGILDGFKDWLVKHNKNKGIRETTREDTVKEVTQGLKVYFDKALGSILLYRFERLQYSELLHAHPGKEMSELYGAEHLLRLFVQMPSLIAHTNMDSDAINVLRDHFIYFLEYLESNLDTFFLKEYDNTTPEYLAAQQK